VEHEVARAPDHVHAEQKQMSQDLKIRLGGVLSIVIAAVAGWWAILLPLQQARAGAAQVSMQLKAAYVLVPLALVFGVAFVALGSRMHYRDTTRTPPTLTPLGWTLFALVAVLSGVLFWVVQSQLSAMGYR
jgi:FtsH-binding integral membrane protein